MKFKNIIKHIKAGTFFRRLVEQPARIMYYYERRREQDFLCGSAKSFISKRSGVKLEVEKGNFFTEMYFAGFELNEIEFIKSYLKTGDYFFDIGANIGLMSLIGSKKVGKNGKVFSFEPVNETRKKLENNIKLNKFFNVEVCGKAISNKSGTHIINSAVEGYDVFSSFGMPAASKAIISETVETITLDEFIEERNIDSKKISLIKLDVEGWEIPALTGGKVLLSLKNAPVIIIEFTDLNASNCGYSTSNLYDQIISLGYTLYEFFEPNILIKETKRNEYPYQNLIAIKDFNKLRQRIKNVQVR